MTIQGLKKVCG